MIHSGQATTPMRTGWMHFTLPFFSLLNLTCSWEPQQNVKQCERLLTSFWKHIGTDDEDYHVGYEVAAQDDWIRETSWLFAYGASDCS